MPTLIEENVREVEVFAFQGLLGPAGMPPATVQRLNAELNKALASTTVLKRFLDFGMEPMPGTPGAVPRLRARRGQALGADHPRQRHHAGLSLQACTSTGWR